MTDDDATMNRVFDTLAPEVTKQVSDKPRAPWFCDRIREHRKEVRMLERRWKASPRDVNRQIFRAKRSEHNRLIDDIKASYYRSRIQNSDQRALFSVIDDMTGDKSALARSLPRHDDVVSLCNEFSNFFCDKVLRIREQLVASSVETELSFTDPSHSFTNFTPVSEADVSKLIL